MDVSYLKLTLHPQASVLLFEHYRTMTRLFRDVLGQLEIDYIGIALINIKNELMFVSSKPSIECNLIERNLWSLDKSYHPEFFLQNKAQSWDELYKTEMNDLLHYKQQIPGFSMGISIPSTFNEYQIVYSFALASTNIMVQKKVLNKTDTLARMGRFCLQNIFRKILLPDQVQPFVMKKPVLKLIVNNEVAHENLA